MDVPYSSHLARTGPISTMVARPPRPGEAKFNEKEAHNASTNRCPVVVPAVIYRHNQQGKLVVRAGAKAR